MLPIREGFDLNLSSNSCKKENIFGVFQEQPVRILIISTLSSIHTVNENIFTIEEMRNGSKLFDVDIYSVVSMLC